MKKSTEFTVCNGGYVNSKKTAIVVLASCLLVAGSAQAEGDDGIKFSASGFLTVAAGKILGGTSNSIDNARGYDGASFVSDYANDGVYEKGKGWMINPDTKLGVQGMARFSDRFSVTGQAVSRGARDGEINLEWAYADVKLNDKLNLQMGRKRLPLFYYSETQDVGLTYPWVHLPQQLYGWEIVNYNGANLLWRDNWGSWSSTVNAFLGSETREENDFWKIYEGRDTRTDSKWSKIKGAEIGMSRDWFEGRFVYIQSDMSNKWYNYRDDLGVITNYNEDGSPLVDDPTKQKIYGLALNADYENWVVRSEFQYIDRKQSGEEDKGAMLGVGYRIGKFLPMVTYARYWQIFKANNDTYIPEWDQEGHATASFVLRYDLTTSSSLKLQIERWIDHSSPGYKYGIDPDTGETSGYNGYGGSPFGGANLISISYDMVF